MSTYISDLAGRVNIGGMPALENSTSRKRDTTELDMTDFLNLMVVQLQNQTIDNTMDTSDMLNQMVQMQMITALANVTDASVMSYASSLVGKEVTIGDYSSGELVEKVVTVTGSGMCDGKQVLFVGNDVYDLSSVMAVGRLPGKDGDSEEDGTEETGRVEGSDSTGRTDAADNTNSTGRTDGADTTNPGNTTNSTDRTGNADEDLLVNGVLDSDALKQRQLETVKDFLSASGVTVPANAAEEELYQLVDEYFESILGEEGSGITQQALEAAGELLRYYKVHMAEDSTDLEIMQAAEAILKAGRIEAEQDPKDESEDEEPVEKTEAAAEDAEVR